MVKLILQYCLGKLPMSQNTKKGFTIIELYFWSRLLSLAKLFNQNIISSNLRCSFLWSRCLKIYLWRHLPSYKKI